MQPAGVGGLPNSADHVIYIGSVWGPLMVVVGGIEGLGVWGFYYVRHCWRWGDACVGLGDTTVGSTVTQGRVVGWFSVVGSIQIVQFNSTSTAQVAIVSTQSVRQVT